MWCYKLTALHCCNFKTKKCNLLKNFDIDKHQLAF